jgi:hypothetical protein
MSALRRDRFGNYAVLAKSMLKRHFYSQANVLVCAFGEQNENILACMPSDYSQQSYDAFNVQ